MLDRTSNLTPTSSHGSTRSNKCLREAEAGSVGNGFYPGGARGERLEAASRLDSRRARQRKKGARAPPDWECHTSEGQEATRPLRRVRPPRPSHRRWRRGRTRRMGGASAVPSHAAAKAAQCGGAHPPTSGPAWDASGGAHRHGKGAAGAARCPSSGNHTSHRKQRGPRSTPDGPLQGRIRVERRRHEPAQHGSSGRSGTPRRTAQARESLGAEPCPP